MIMISERGHQTAKRCGLDSECAPRNSCCKVALQSRSVVEEDVAWCNCVRVCRLELPYWNLHTRDLPSDLKSTLQIKRNRSQAPPRPCTFMILNAKRFYHNLKRVCATATMGRTFYSTIPRKGNWSNGNHLEILVCG